MAIPSKQLDFLRDWSIKLKYPSKRNLDPVKKTALKIISDLTTELKNKNLSLEEWNEIYEAVQPYTEIDLSTNVGIIESVFSYIFRPESIVDTLIGFINARRKQQLRALFEEEKLKVTKEHVQLVHKIINSSTPTYDPQEIKDAILSLRTTSPRLILSVQDEIVLLRSILDVHLKIWQAKQKSLPDVPLQGTKNLQTALNFLQGNPFTFSHYIEQASRKNRHETGAVLLQPDPDALSQAAVGKLRIQRLFRLENLEKLYTQSQNAPDQHVASKLFEPTYAWYVGAFWQKENFAPFELEMQKIGEEHGIKVISDIKLAHGNSIEVTEENRTDLMIDCEPILESDISHGDASVLGAFSQDFVDFCRNGEIRIPRMAPPGENIELASLLTEDRIKRSEQWREIAANLGKSNLMHFLGTPIENNLSLKAIALASSLNTSPIMNLTYNEGGNALIGKKGDQPYVIIGLDSYAASKTMMEHDLGRKMTHDEVLMAFAIDYGVRKENLYFVEQPGDFHLDMSMAIVGENTILLNDAVEAQRLFGAEQQSWLTQAISHEEALVTQAKRELEALSTKATKGQVESVTNSIAMLENYSRIFESQIKEEIEQASVRKKLEDVTENELKRHGFKVIRVPGRFHYTSRVPAMNFFNMVTAETPRGENVAVLLGCTGDYATRFEQGLRQHCDRKIDKIYFLDLKSSQDCLGLGGGISCRTKTIPLQKPKGGHIGVVDIPQSS
ncbi:MAG: hypothetical protein JSS60_07495 [Verrucomicrobia bacterium]|nr:hypothetical protein [Verrucomicrobiota bacterium]